MSFASSAFRVLLLAGLWTAVPAASQAQSSTSTTANGFALKDGAYRLNGVVMQLQAGQSTRLSAPLKFTNGLTLRPDGIMVAKDGARQLLGEGKAINPQGDVVNLRDDMMAAEAIQQYDQKVTGATPTVVPSRSIPVDPTITATLRQTEARLQVLRQLADRLNQRASTALGTNSQAEAAQLDAKLRTLDARLRR
ncbi:DUF6799 domain-containing protein [Hymenobacter mucosus]|uniref:DUF6799 domain-containing protein n=1 Tax=Hymenobacter mucosus TaxID=1411120 RepID=A0A239B5H1_9BACT|nr:DUF6799 domain-containing protein [Hymenobacter mucosus]SNS03155.1 hypothetical protein SAMN06269173_11846 [Hymenobacter mucosus]